MFFDVSPAHQGSVNEVRFMNASPTLLFSCGNDGMVNLWDRRKGLVSALNFNSQVNAIDVNPSDTALAIASKNVVSVVYAAHSHARTQSAN
jgi:WD40 repeat protein